MYWNLCNEVDPHVSREAVKSLVEDQQIDVVCLQEVPYVRDEVGDKKVFIPLSRILAEDLGMDEVFEHTRTIKKTDKEIKGYGSAVLSRSPIIDKSIEVLRDDRFSYMTSHPENQRVLISARTELEPNIIINSAHMSYALPLKVGKKGMRTEQSRLAQILRQQMQTFEVVFGGDLNTKPGTILDKLLEATGLRSVLANTMPTFRSRHWFAGHIKRNLDRVFVSSGIQAKGEVGDQGHSDHHPVIVDVDKNK